MTIPTFIYSPGVKVFIQTEKSGLVDVSDDLVSGSMQRRSDGISTFNFSLSNPQRKYDSVFTPNDRIIVMMKRLAWVRTLTGLLNSVPLITAWPMTVPLTASCSLKRLQYWFWDSHAAATQLMIRNAMSVVGSTNADGATNVILTILDQVVGWPASKVHIAQIPSNWFKIAEKVAQAVNALGMESDQLVAEFKKNLSDKGIIGESPGTGTTGAAIDGKLQPGMYGSTKMTEPMCRIAEAVYSTCISMGGSQRDGVIGLITVRVESIFGSIPMHRVDHTSEGIFQQQDPWGSSAQRNDPAKASALFYKRLLLLSDRDKMTPGQAAQTIQGSAFPTRYQEHVPMGEAIVHALITGQGSVAGTVGGANATDNTPHVGRKASPGGTSGTSTGYALAQRACHFTDTYTVPYQTPCPRDETYLMKEPPGVFDCSSFVVAMYMRTLGTSHGMYAQTDSIVAFCEKHKSKKLTVAQAMATPGAVVFAGRYPGTTHMEISLGNGTDTVGAHRKGTNAGVVSWGPSQFDFGYQLPFLTYPAGAAAVVPGAGGAAGTDPAAAQANPTYARDLPGFNPNDPFDKLFGDNAWATPAPENDPEMTLSESLGGVRALLNDQPLMPYLMNLFNAQMRMFCSAPNGDLIAWFPDYYGIWGTAARMIVEPIEVQDFTVMWSDDHFVTHQFTLAGQVNYLDVASGSINTDFQTNADGSDIRTTTLGIASIDIPALMWALFGIDATENEANAFAQKIYRRFGARPAYQEMPGLVGPKAEFFSAIYMFMQGWAYQYNADIPLTFMPELYPGMLIQIPKFDFQAYVVAVTHTFSFGKGGGFATSVNIAAPARMPKKAGDRDNVLIGLPLAGDYKPGRGVGNIDPAGVEYT